MRLGTVLACVLSFACGGAALMSLQSSNASTVMIGKGTPPGALQACLDIVNRMQDLGTDPSGAELLAGLADLDTEVASVLQFEDTGVPADVCVVSGQCAAVSSQRCTQGGFQLNRSYIKRGVCWADCSDLSLGDSDRTVVYWGGWVCP